MQGKRVSTSGATCLGNTFHSELSEFLDDKPDVDVWRLLLLALLGRLPKPDYAVVNCVRVAMGMMPLADVRKKATRGCERLPEVAGGSGTSLNLSQPLSTSLNLS